jgi:tetratricopeptide (TPR) repeat protein
MRIAALLALVAFACAHPEDRQVATTDGALAVANLSAQIEGRERILTRRPKDVGSMAALIELYGARARFAGRAGDYRRIAALGEAAVEASPASPEARLARASSRASLHLFADALGDLELADDTPAARSLRASILEATGHRAEALRLRRAAVREWVNTRNLGALAASQPDVPTALEHFAAAERVYRDTSPFPPAWIAFQRGLLFERHGRFDDARQAYGAALRILPQYVAARTHLAGVLAILGQRKQAERLLRPLVAAEDPEAEAGLAALVEDRREAARLREHVSARYEELLREFPEAFADHAARFYLPRQPARALALARINLAVRQTPEAYELALSAAAGADVSDCSLAMAAASTSNALASLGASVCPKISR